MRMTEDAVFSVPRRWIVSLTIYVPPIKTGRENSRSNTEYFELLTMINKFAIFLLLNNLSQFQFLPQPQQSEIENKLTQLSGLLRLPRLFVGLIVRSFVKVIVGSLVGEVVHPFVRLAV
jgi:hypothetical protein